MSLEETKQLLRVHKISPNKILGQNFMVEPSFYLKMCNYAEIGKEDIVLDVGAGFGWLTCFLANKCRKIVAVEKDPNVTKVLREQVKNLDNVSVIEGDVLKVALPEFNKVVAIPPYYLSSHLILWLLEKKVECAVLILQKEFAARLIASCGSEEYGWITVVTNQGAAVELLDSVTKEMFYPQPEVDSVVVSLKFWRTKPFEVKDHVSFVRMTKWLFSQRNKKLAKAIAPFIKSNFKLSKQDAEKLSHSLPFIERRVRELSPNDFGALTNALYK